MLGTHFSQGCYFGKCPIADALIDLLYLQHFIRAPNVSEGANGRVCPI
jgi:hypothetical protein